MHQLGIIGCGWVAPFHVQALNQLSDRAQVKWVADPDPQRADHVARQIKSDSDVDILTDYRDGLDRVDCVSVLVPHHLHHPITIDALDANCHVLLEKPFAMNLTEADDMIAKADAVNRVLMVAYPHRYRKSTQRFKQLIDSGAYGKLFMLDAMMDEDLRAYVSGWMTTKATLGGGVFFSASPHMLDVMLWIGGRVHSISMVGTRAGLNMEGEDTALAIIKFTSGVVGSTRHTWFSPKPQTWYMMTAFCEKAKLTLTVSPSGDLAKEGHRCLWKSRIDVSGATDDVLLDTDEGLDFTQEVTHFFDCIDHQIPCQIDGRSVRELMVVLFDAIRKAEADGSL